MSNRLKELKVMLYQHELIKTYKEQEKQWNQILEQLNKEINKLIHEEKNCIKKSHKK